MNCKSFTSRIGPRSPPRRWISSIIINPTCQKERKDILEKGTPKSSLLPCRLIERHHLFNIATAVPISTNPIPFFWCWNNYVCWKQGLHVWCEVTSKLHLRASLIWINLNTYNSHEYQKKESEQQPFFCPEFLQALCPSHPSSPLPEPSREQCISPEKFHAEDIIFCFYNLYCSLHTGKPKTIILRTHPSQVLYLTLSYVLYNKWNKCTKRVGSINLK